MSITMTELITGQKSTTTDPAKLKMFLYNDLIDEFPDIGKTWILDVTITENILTICKIKEKREYIGKPAIWAGGLCDADTSGLVNRVWVKDEKKQKETAGIEGFADNDVLKPAT